jgi:hypothetical protein
MPLVDTTAIDVLITPRPGENLPFKLRQGQHEVVYVFCL